MSEQTIAIVSSNPGKHEEISSYLSRYLPQMKLELSMLDIEEIQSIDQRAIALDKAHKAYATLKRPLLIDDAGVFFEEYTMFPGTMTKFVFHGLGFEGILRLAEGKPAHFLLTLVYVDAHGTPHVFEGRTDGTIVRKLSDNYPPTLPWDAIFVPNGSNKTFAELRYSPDAEQFLYRMRALKKFVEWYKSSQSSF